MLLLFVMTLRDFLLLFECSELANTLSLVVCIGMHSCMHAEVCGALVTASCVWNVSESNICMRLVRML